MATGYVTNWGNDANDGLSWETSKRTFQGASDAGLSPVYAKGWFNEVPHLYDNNTSFFSGYDYLIIDGSFLGDIMVSGWFRVSSNLILKNIQSISGGSSLENSFIKRCNYFYSKNYIPNFNNCILINSGTFISEYKSNENIIKSNY